MLVIRRNDPSFPGQDIINSEYDCQADKIVSDDEGNEEWFFEKILDLYNIFEDLQYKIKWLYPHRPIWEFIMNVQSYDNNIVIFYIKHFRKLGPSV